MTYLLDVAQLSNAPAQPGRFLGLLVPLTAGLSGPSPARFSIDDAQVLNVACRDAGGIATLCGHRSGTAWTAALQSPEDTTLMLQVDAPEVG